MKIATFNVNGISARLSALLRWLAESKPDVAFLQELKAPREKLPEAAIREAGYGVIWHGQKSWNGVAILARGPFIRDAGLRIHHLLLSPSAAARLVSARGRSRSPWLGESERPRAHLDCDRGGSTISMRSNWRTPVVVSLNQHLLVRYIADRR
jgi:exonuclease III